jgi:hypothetical protein
MTDGQLGTFGGGPRRTGRANLFGHNFLKVGVERNSTLARACASSPCSISWFNSSVTVMASFPISLRPWLVVEFVTFHSYAAITLPLPRTIESSISTYLHCTGYKP